MANLNPQIRTFKFTRMPAHSSLDKIPKSIVNPIEKNGGVIIDIHPLPTPAGTYYRNIHLVQLDHNVGFTADVLYPYEPSRFPP